MAWFSTVMTPLTYSISWVGTVAAVAASLGAPLALAGPTLARPLACAAVTNPEHRAAVGAAEAWMAERWQRTGQVWSAVYQLKPAPALPLGMAMFKSAAALVETSGAGAASPIRGRVAVSRMVCTTSTAGPGQGYVVRFVGRGLTFDENGSGWSRPLAKALIQVLEVRTPDAASPPALQVTPSPTAPTALPPDAELSLPGPADVATLPHPRRAR